jgi:hypothetical protein
MPVSARTWIWGGLLVAVALVVPLAGTGWIEAPPERAGHLNRPQPAGTSAAPAALAIAPPAVPASWPAATASGAPSVVLSGVALGVDRGNVAIVSVNQGPDVLVRVGDAMTAATTVLRIDDASMTYRFANTELRVFVKPLQANTAAALTPIAPPKPMPGFVAGAPAMARAPGVEPGSGNEAFRQAVEKKIQAIAAGR